MTPTEYQQGMVALVADREGATGAVARPLPRSSGAYVACAHDADGNLVGEALRLVPSGAGSRAATRRERADAGFANGRVDLEDVGA